MLKTIATGGSKATSDGSGGSVPTWVWIAGGAVLVLGLFWFLFRKGGS